MGKTESGLKYPALTNRRVATRNEDAAYTGVEETAENRVELRDNIGAFSNIRGALRFLGQADALPANAIEGDVVIVNSSIKIYHEGSWRDAVS